MADLTVALVLRAVDRLSGPLRRAGRSVGQLARAAERSARGMQRAGAASRRMAEEERRARQEVERTTKAVQRQAKALERLARMRERAARRLRDRGLAIAGKLAAGGAAATAGAWGIRRLVESPVEALRRVEKAKGELATLQPKNIDVWVRKAREAQAKIAGVTAETFLRAGYDIKSALSHLTDEAGAEMTTAVAWTAKATGASMPDIAELFAGVYGVFRDQYRRLSDAAFGDVTAGMTAAAVKTFKTTGSRMRQALQSATAAPAKVGMSMAEVFAVLGKLQETMEAGEAGTALKAFAAKAAEAERRFRKRGLRIRLLDKQGMLRDVADVLADMRKAFGETLDAREMALIQKAFGSEEAVKLIANLWGKEKAMRAYVRAMKEGAAAGRQLAITMAMEGMQNLDARLALLAQKWDLLKQQVGTAFAPALSALIPRIAAIIDAVRAWLKLHPKIAASIGGMVIGLGMLLAVIGPVMMGLSTLVGTVTMAAFAFRLFRAAALRGMAAEILEVGAAMSSVARKRWRLPQLVWRAFITPLKWAAFIPRLAWRALVAPLRWAALVPKLAWRTFVTPLKWAGALIPRIPWVALAGKLKWGLLIRPLSWVALRVIPAIGWATLAGELVWDLLIKPLGWDKYITPTLAAAWQKVRDTAGATWEEVRQGLGAIDWNGIVNTGLTAAWDKAAATARDAWERARAALGAIDWDGIIGTGRAAWQKAEDAAGKAWEKVKGVFAPIDLTAIGQQTMESFGRGLQNLWDSIRKWWDSLKLSPKSVWVSAKKVVEKVDATLSSIPGMPVIPAPQKRHIKRYSATGVIQEKAKGGWMRAGLPTLVGERGPELIFPDRAGWVASNDNLRRFAARVSRARRDLMRLTAAAAVAAPLVQVPAMAPPSPAAAGGGSIGTVAQRQPALRAPVQMTVNITIQAETGADPRMIAREVERHLRRASRSLLGDHEDGGAA